MAALVRRRVSIRISSRILVAFVSPIRAYRRSRTSSGSVEKPAALTLSGMRMRMFESTVAGVLRIRSRRDRVGSFIIWAGAILAVSPLRIKTRLKNGAGLITWVNLRIL